MPNPKPVQYEIWCVSVDDENNPVERLYPVLTTESYDTAVKAVRVLCAQANLKKGESYDIARYGRWVSWERA